MLLGAVDDFSDGEIAERLNISPHTVNMRWRTIYNRIDAHPELAAAVLRPDEGRNGNGANGHHKRRRVVAFVRAHPEELRPYDDSSARSPPSARFSNSRSS